MNRKAATRHGVAHVAEAVRSFPRRKRTEPGRCPVGRGWPTTVKDRALTRQPASALLSIGIFYLVRKGTSDTNENGVRFTPDPVQRGVIRLAAENPGKD